MLQETCMLVSLRIGLPPQTKQAKKASEKIEDEYQTAKRQGRVTKQLFTRQDIQPLVALQARIRTEFNDRSLPYDDAYRIIPSDQYFEFMEGMGKLSSEFDEAKHKFLRNYEDITRRALTALGRLYNSDDYPSVDSLKGRIQMRIEASPLPEVSQFDSLAGITPEAAEELKDQALAHQQEKVDRAVYNLFERLFEAMKKAFVKLNNPDSIFRDTLIENILSAAEAIETLNITNNEELITMANQVREITENINTPDTLRKDKKFREQTALEIKEQLDYMEQFV